MTDELIERVAKAAWEADIETPYGRARRCAWPPPEADNIAEFRAIARAIVPLVQAHERERCARVAEEYHCRACGQWFHPSDGHYDEDCPKGRASWGDPRDSEEIAAAIRAGEQP